jgi:hypothetical protein
MMIIQYKEKIIHLEWLETLNILTKIDTRITTTDLKYITV